MFTRKIGRGLILCLSLGCLSGTALQTTAEDKKVIPTLKVRETLQETSVTLSEINASETRSEMKGKVKVEITLPLDSAEVAGVGKDTLFVAQIGLLKIIKTPGDSPDWTPGKSEARISLAQPSQDGTAKRVIGTLRLKWSKDRLNAVIEGDLPSVGHIAAVRYKNDGVGKIEAEITGEVKFGSRAQKFRIVAQAEIKREEKSQGNLSGSRTTVELRGEGKPVAPEITD
jgi:hypothetical protein